MTTKVRLTSCVFPDSKRGSATMEYIIVSTFAALLSITAITFVGNLVKSRIDKIAAKLKVDSPEFDLSFE